MRGRGNLPRKIGNADHTPRSAPPRFPLESRPDVRRARRHPTRPNFGPQPAARQASAWAATMVVAPRRAPRARSTHRARLPHPPRDSRQHHSSTSGSIDRWRCVGIAHLPLRHQLDRCAGPSNSRARLERHFWRTRLRRSHPLPLLAACASHRRTQNWLGAGRSC